MTASAHILDSFVLRRSVTLAGIVRRQDGASARSGWVRLLRKPPDGVAAARGGPGAAGRDVTAAIRKDGSYYFLDLPPGEFEVSGNDERNHLIEVRSVAIAAPGKRGIRCLELHFDLTVSNVAGAEATRPPSMRSAEIGRTSSANRMNDQCFG